jgi:hypothetical protein
MPAKRISVRLNRKNKSFSIPEWMFWEWEMFTYLDQCSPDITEEELKRLAVKTIAEYLKRKGCSEKNDSDDVQLLIYNQLIIKNNMLNSKGSREWVEYLQRRKTNDNN